MINKIIIITDGYNNYGIGHIIRCKEIENEFKNLGLNVELHILSQIKIQLNEYLTQNIFDQDFHPNTNI